MTWGKEWSRNPLSYWCPKPKSMGSFRTSQTPLSMHAAFLDISKIEPGQIPQKFHNMDDQSTFLNILEEKLGAISRNLWSYYRPKYWAQFIKASYRRNHFRQKFITGKIFATIHLRKKLVSNFPDSGSGIRIRTI